MENNEITNDFVKNAINVLNKQDNAEDIKQIGNSNFKLVPMSYVRSMRNALALTQGDFVLRSCYHDLFGWTVEIYAYETRLEVDAIDLLFKKMQGTYDSSCKIICQNPTEHFKKRNMNNRCFPICKVFEVFHEHCFIAATRMIEPQLIVELYNQVIQKDEDNNDIIINKPVSLFEKYFRKKLSVVLIDCDHFKITDGTINQDEKMIRQVKYTNLKKNLENNFDCITIMKYNHEAFGTWDKRVKDILNIKNQVLILLFNQASLENMIRWSNSIFDSSPINTLYQESEKDQFSLWRHMYYSGKVKLGVVFDEPIFKKAVDYFQLAFLYPRDKNKLLCLIEEYRKIV